MRDVPSLLVLWGWRVDSPEHSAEQLEQSEAPLPQKVPEQGPNVQGEVTPVEQETELRVAISADAMQAFLTLRANPPKPYPFTSDAIMQALRERGVVEGILVDEIRRIVETETYVADLQIARGIRPQDGEDARIEFFFDPSPKLHPFETEGKIDWHEVHLIQRVAQNQRLARRIPARSGTSGSTVTGRRLEPRRVRDVRLPVGRGTKISESDPNELLAATAGAVRMVSNQVVVDKVINIARDIDYSVGNIDVDGSVQIGGNVLSGFRVKATGDVHITGSVEGATVESGGSVSVSEGVFGHTGATVRAAKDAVVKYARNASIVAEGNITVHLEAIHCDLRSGGTISVGAPGGKRGRIVGGQVCALVVRAVDLGAEIGTPTTVVVDTKALGAREQVVHETRERITRLRDEHAAVTAEAGNISHQRSADRSAWGARQEQQLARLAALSRHLEDELHSLEAQLAKLAHVEEPRVIVHGTLFPGVRISFGRVSRLFCEQLKSVLVTLTEDRSTIIVRDLKHPA